MIQVRNTHIQDDIARIERRYNGDNDLIPGAPMVTWTDRELLELVKTLFKMVEDLQDQIRMQEPSEEERAGKSYSEYFHGRKPTDNINKPDPELGW